MTKYISAALTAFGLVFAGGAGAQEIVVSTPGGSYLDEVTACAARPFEQATGVKAILVPNNSVQAAAKLRATKGNPEFDVIVVDIEIATPLAREGLLEKLDFAQLKNRPDILPQAFDPDGFFINNHSNGTVIAYNPELIDKPESWADVLDPRYKGKIALPDITGTAGVHFLLAVNRLKGGTLDNVDPGFEAIKAIKDNVLMYYTQADQIVPLLQRGEIVMAPWYVDRIGSAVDTGVPVAVSYPKEGGVAVRSTISVPAGSKNKDHAMAFIDYELSPEAQKCFADRKYAGPVNVKAEPSETAAKVLPSTADLDNLWKIDFDVIAAKRPEWIERWQREIAR
jgi:putative spermidine/putrescine transport system substrate-binding protein